MSGELDVFDEVFASNVVDHDPAPDQGPGPDGFKAFFSTMRTAFPDLHIEVEHEVADDDNIAIAYTLTGTHQGEFMGIAPTGNKISVRGMQIARFENGMLVERWGSSDEVGLLSQIGVDPVG
jgi:steroid delta-isomerase-like uncharacterized protein